MSTTLRRTGRATALGVVAALGLSALAVSPALADTGTWVVGGSGSVGNNGETVSVADAVIEGNAIHLEGTGWLDGKADSESNGSWIGVKLGAVGVEGDNLTSEPAGGKFVFPGASSGSGNIWSGIVAEDDGSFSADIPFPTIATTTNPALAAEWTAGTTHHLQLLTGSLKPGGDTPRSVYVTFTISAENLTVTAASGGRGAPAGQVTLTATSGEGRFAPNEALIAAVDGNAVAWASGGTADASGTLGRSTLVFAPGVLRAGDHEVTLTGATSGTATSTVTVLPTATFSGLTQGAEGTLTLGNLPDGSSVSAVSLDGSSVAFTGLPAAAAADGSATVPYTVPADAALGSFPVTVTLANPAATYTLAAQKVSPDASVSGEDAFTIISNGENIFQGLYQSAYSTSEKALFATAASGTGANEDGYLYKIDPTTLEVLASAHPKDLVDPADEPGQAPYGVGVDDVNGNVWVTNTRTGAVAVYSANDLALLKQFPKSSISHPRDAIYDPASDRVFVSSASEGTSGDGYISVYDAKTFEKIGDVQTGARADYSPMSLAVDNGILVSPSLSSNKVVKVNTQTLEFSFLTITGINVGGRGASGIAFDAAANRLYIASQNSDEVVVADATTGATLKEIPTGGGALNIAFDRVNGLAYVANFGGTTVTVLDADGNRVANLPIARANHVSLDDEGNAYVVDKAAGNKVWKISLKEDENPGGENPGGENPGGENPGGENPGGENPGTSNPKPSTTPAAPAASADQLPGALKNKISISVSGTTGTVTVPGASEGQWFYGYAYSQPTALGWHQTDASGKFTVDLSGLAAGTHTLAILDADGDLVGWATFEISASGAKLLSTTGNDALMPLAALGALTLLAGGVAVAAGRRRRAGGAE